MVIVGKYISGITIKPLEYLLGASGSVRGLAIEHIVKMFLKEKGFTDDKIYWLVFEPVQEGDE